MINEAALPLAQKIARRYAQLPEVEAVAVAGSQATGQHSAGSDIDIYIYIQQDLPAEKRRAIANEFAPHVEIVDYWGPGVEWDDPETGVHIDTVYFPVAFIQDQVDRVMDRHEAWVGYSTSFWHTVRVSHPLFDREGWFARLQAKAAQPYPEAMVSAIIKQNYPLLRDSFSSYRRQIEKAASREDYVSLNHRTAGLLASYFDILFAINRLPHPGEKRLMALAETLCPKRPANMRAEIDALLQAAVSAPDQCVSCVNTLVNSLDAVLSAEGLKPR